MCASRALRGSISMTISLGGASRGLPTLGFGVSSTDEAFIPEVGLDSEMATAALMFYEGFQRLRRPCRAFYCDADRACFADDHLTFTRPGYCIRFDALRDVVRASSWWRLSTVSAHHHAHPRPAHWRTYPRPCTSWRFSSFR